MNEPLIPDADTPQQRKQRAARAALQHLREDMILGVGTGSTVNVLIDLLAPKISQIRLRGAISSSEGSSTRLRSHGIPVLDLNDLSELPLYIDGADEANRAREVIKGGGAALAREKSGAAPPERFIGIVDNPRPLGPLGRFPLPLEVIPMARNSVARRLER